MLIRSLVELHAWLHSYLCFSLIEKLFLSNLDNSSTLNLSIELLNCFLSQSRHLLTARWINWESSWSLDSFSITSRFVEIRSIASQHLFDTWLFVELLSCFLSQSWQLSTARWIDRESSWPFDSFLTASRSIEVGSIASRHLAIDRDPLACIVFHMFWIFLLSCHPYYLVSLHSCIFMDSLCPLDHLYLSWVKRSNFLYPLSIMTKRRRNCGNTWFLFKDSIC